jgi:hypothetical protein
MLPQVDRVTQAADSGKWDIARFVGGNLGISNYHVDAESRLRSKIAIASDYEHAKTAVMHQDPKALREMFAKDPDAAVYLAFRPYIQQSLGQLGKIDQATELVSSSAQAPDRKGAAIAALEKAREQEMVKADKVDQAVEMVLKHVHERHSGGMPLTAKPSAINRAPL